MLRSFIFLHDVFAPVYLEKTQASTENGTGGRPKQLNTEDALGLVLQLLQID